MEDEPHSNCHPASSTSPAEPMVEGQGGFDCNSNENHELHEAPSTINASSSKMNKDGAATAPPRLQSHKRGNEMQGNPSASRAVSAGPLAMSDESNNKTPDERQSCHSKLLNIAHHGYLQEVRASAADARRRLKDKEAAADIFDSSTSIAHS